MILQEVVSSQRGLRRRWIESGGSAAAAAAVAADVREPGGGARPGSRPRPQETHHRGRRHCTQGDYLKLIVIPDLYKDLIHQQ